LLNEATNVSRSTVTNERGEYVFASLAPATYTLVAELSGFAPYRATDIDLGVNRALVIDVPLSVGGIEETITVTGETPLIETATASVASAIDKAQLEVLPTPGRNVFIMAVTTPNVVHTGDPVFVRQQDQTNASLLSLGGGPLRGNLYTIDGVATTDLRNRSVINPNFEGVDEMKVQVATYDAEMGRTGGGVFNTIHRAGTNDYRGSGLWQNRPSWGRSTLFFEDEVPDTSYNLWGGSAGGPIIHDKLFFWASTEGYKNIDTRNQVVILPTAAMANGDFRGTGITIYDPLTFDPATGTRQPFPNNIIPPGRLDPVGLALAQQLVSVAEGPTSATASLNNTAWQVTGRADWNMSPTWQLSGTYMFYKSEEPANKYYEDIVGDVVPFDPGAGTLFRDVNLVAINLTNIPSDDSVVTFRYGYTRFFDSVSTPEFDISSLPFSQSFISEFESVGIPRFPYVNVLGYGEDTNTGNNATHGGWASDNIIWKSQEVSGTYSKFVGSHTMKAGAQFRRIGVDTLLPGYVAKFNFNGDFTRGPNAFNPAAGTGDGLASLLLGLPLDTDTNFVKATETDVFVNYFGFFIQDDWRATDRLVFNFGLRIESETGLQEKEDRFATGFDRDAPFPVQVPGLNLRGGLIYPGTGGPSEQSDEKSIKLGPRAGFAYSINPDTVLRGGYGIFWAPHQYPGPGEQTFGTIGYTAVTNYVSSFDGINPASQGSGSPGSLTDPYPGGIASPTGDALGLLTGAGETIHFNDQFAKSSSIQQWSLDVQRELGAGLAFKVGYVGSKSTDLWIGGTADGQFNINQLAPEFLNLGPALNEPVANPFFGNPVFGGLSLSPTIARGQLLRPYPQFRDLWLHHFLNDARYDAIRVEFEKRFRGSWGARVNYTYSRNRSNSIESNTRVSDEQFQVFNSSDPDDDPLPRARIDSPHWLNINGLYRFPSPSGGVAETILGGWQASVTAIIRSGFPLNITQSTNNLGSGFGFDHQRPDLVGDPSVSGSTEDKFGNYVNPDAFQNAQAFTFGNTPFTISDYRTPKLVDWDVSFDKMTELGGGANLLLRFEIINIFNQPNWNGPASVFGEDDFGVITGVGGFPRVFQFMAKVLF
jgi:hypothetical protein